MNVSPWSGEGLFDASPAIIFSYKIFNTSGSYLQSKSPSILFIHPYIFNFFPLRCLLSPNPNPSLHLSTSSFPYRHVSQ